MKLLITILIQIAVIAIYYYLGYNNGAKHANRELQTVDDINFNVNKKIVLSVSKNKTNDGFDVTIYDSKYLDFLIKEKKIK